MRIKYTYIANDGAEFNSQEECVVHEERLAIKNLQVIKNRINGIENFEGYWAELYLINSREDYEDVLFYLGEDAKGKLTTNFNNDNLGWFIHWVEPGEGKPDEHYLLNYKYYFRSIHESLMLFDKRIQEEISKRDSTKERENNTAEKIIKESEPQYPTWREWQRENFPSANEPITPCIFKSVDELGCIGTRCSICEFNPIPADLAKKLGVKPKKEQI